MCWKLAVPMCFRVASKRVSLCFDGALVPENLALRRALQVPAFREAEAEAGTRPAGFSVRSAVRGASREVRPTAGHRQGLRREAGDRSSSRRAPSALEYGFLGVFRRVKDCQRWRSEAFMEFLCTISVHY